MQLETGGAGSVVAVQVENACLALSALQCLGVLKDPSPAVLLENTMVHGSEDSRVAAALDDGNTHMASFSQGLTVGADSVELSLQQHQQRWMPQPLFHSFYWPCRFERFSLCGCDIIVDGAHNGDSVARFVEAIIQYANNHDASLAGSGAITSDGSGSVGNLSSPSSLQSDCIVLLLFGAGKEKCLSDMLEVLLGSPTGGALEGKDQLDSGEGGEREEGREAGAWSGHERGVRVLLTQSSHFKALSEQQLLQHIPLGLRDRVVAPSRYDKASLPTVASVENQSQNKSQSQSQTGLSREGSGDGDETYFMGKIPEGTVGRRFGVGYPTECRQWTEVN